MYSVDRKPSARRGAKHRFEFAMRLLLLCSSVLVTLVVVEMLLRLFPNVLPEEARLRIHWREIEVQTDTIAHPKLGFILPPSRLGTRAGTDFTFSFKTDERGFRNPSPWPSTAEIVVAGDSMAFSYGVDDEAAWTRLLGEWLSPSRIINLGLIGAAPQQYLRAFETFGIPLKPKLFIFALFPGNDFEDAERFDEWLEAGSPGNYDVWRFFEGETPDAIDTVLKDTYLYMLVRTLRRGFRFPVLGMTIEMSDGGRIRMAPRVYAMQAARARPSEPAFQRVVAIVEKARDVARANGARFLVLMFPTKEEVYLPLQDEPAPELIAPIVNVLDELRIPYLDLRAPLQKEARLGKTLYFEIDGHPNELGYAIVARAVYDHFAKNAAMYGLNDLDPKGR